VRSYEPESGRKIDMKGRLLFRSGRGSLNGGY
jgi:hypothetical protein